MLDVPMPTGLAGASIGSAQLSPKSSASELPKHFPIVITKTENGFLTEVQYANAKRVYTDFDALAADLKTCFED